jgi:upstream activation factor subunit UAF30
MSVTTKKTKSEKPKTDKGKKKVEAQKVDSKVSTPKAETKVKEMKVQEVPVVPQEVKVETTGSDTELHDQTALQFTNISVLVQEIQGQLSKLRTELKVVEKSVSKEMKHLDKVYSKKKKNKGTRAPSGFVKPTKISDELALFLSKEPGAMMARTDVTKEMTNYIRENKLQDKENGRKIIPDDKLTKLLNIDSSVELTYFNLQKYMSPHFEKSPVTEKV